VAKPAAHRCIAITPRCDHVVDDAAVFTLVRHRCWACHAADGIAGHDFPDLDALRKAPVADMVGTCQMPPDGAPLPEPERTLLVDWSTCSKR
jgi:hypothetical protein